MTSDPFNLRRVTLPAKYGRGGLALLPSLKHPGRRWVACDDGEHRLFTDAELKLEPLKRRRRATQD